ncbi:hypothetical protein DFO45_1458 [Azorhizobium sp. AG788]|uniref:hypothetical protein n=1 Tax=Azorhizobium sp. AG788 TaxID=2183897 RepID=UPI0010604B83|nr:hypothetical protein [Azorhizobium sp. AG788]TDT99747.1 hypothetical protein DFO45_1458 [Azorhizobium sp. AG788]
MSEPDPSPLPCAGDHEALSRLEGICRQIAKGDYDNVDDLFALTVAEDASETIHQLAEAFGFMLVQVEAREMRLNMLIEDLTGLKEQLEIANGKLKQENAELSVQLKRLTVEIDRQELKKHVGAIVETEYFQDLQQRAREMRARHMRSDQARDE